MHLIQGWETTLRSPRIWHRAQFHAAYSNQIAQATAPITGGLICPAGMEDSCPLAIPPGYSPVDHDQRNTLNMGLNATLPSRAFADFLLTGKGREILAGAGYHVPAPKNP